VEGLAAPATAWGGYAAPTRDGLLFGATHERGETRIETGAAATDRNLQTLAARLPTLAARVTEAGHLHSRAAVRATTPDRLPLAGQVASGLFVLTGLGSRGFCVAPLLAEHVAGPARGGPAPRPTAPSARVDPKRFVIAEALAQPLPQVDG
jgi:tRNA 5-methylaminomethyl-2-thiouridine biosynthesis bifunctional protein